MSWDHKQSIKEVIKHVLFVTNAYKVLEIYRRRRGYVTDHMKTASAQERFSEIYRLGTWVHVDGQESRSGRGSESSTTSLVVSELPNVLFDLGCTLLLDVGCGDWNWMSRIDLPCRYIGIDIVPEVIEKNKAYERYGVEFLLANACEDELPSADVALCREVLFHLSFADGIATLRNIKKRCKWLIATTDNSIWFNSNIPTGDFRNINLQRSPYYLPKPYRTISDNALSPHRVLGIWRTSDILL